MKKKSRFLTGLLSAVMAMSLFAMPAAAAGETNVATIDTTKTGSLTIEKYEGDNTENPLEGVEFTIYKVADIEQTTDADGKVGISYKSLIGDNVKIDADSTYSEIKDAVEKANLTNVGKEKTKLDANGKASVKFDKLSLGIYLVEESDAPTQVVSRSANFLVSIPMVNAAGTGWTYDVVAEPKNTTVYGGITLIKYGKEGNGTETTLGGATFVLQRKVNNTWTTLTKSDNANLTDDGFLTTSTNETNKGMITIDGLEPGDYRFVEVKAPNGYIVDGKTAYAFTISIDGNGKTKYDIDDSYKGDNDSTIKVVNEKPTLDKTVKSSTGDTYGNAADYSVNDTVNWKVTATVPSKIGELKAYTLTDTMSNQLTWVSDEAAQLTIATTPSVSLTANDDYVLTTPANNTKGGQWVIEFTEAGRTKLATGKVTTIEVTFNTTLNEDALVGNTGNLNDAKLEYSNGIYPTEDPDNPNNGKQPSKDTVTDQAIIYTFGLNAVKVDGQNENPLAGAEFDLYLYTGNEQNPTEAQLKADGTLIQQLKSDDDGKLNVKALKNGRYFLVETKAPTYTVDGKSHSYNLLKAPVEVKIDVTYKVTKTTNTTTDTDGKVTTTTTVTQETFTGGENNNGTYQLTIKNNKGFDLPTTGGFGTLLFSCIGALLVVGGVGVLMTTKKKKGNA